MGYNPWEGKSPSLRCLRGYALPKGDKNGRDLIRGRALRGPGWLTATLCLPMTGLKHAFRGACMPSVKVCFTEPTLPELILSDDLILQSSLILGSDLLTK